MVRSAAIPSPDHGDVLDWPFEPIPVSDLQGSVVDRFNAVARQFSPRLAVDDGTGALTYFELAALVDVIAEATTAEIAGCPGPVAILLHHEARFPAAILGVLAAGRACVPLDADYPMARNRMIASHAGAAAVVSVGSLAAEARALFPHLPVLDIETLGRPKAASPRRRPAPADVAYILYTSGSTGTPKGVYQDHRGVVRDIMQCVDVQHLSCEDHVALFYSPTVASGFRIALSALLVGASLHVLPPKDLGPGALAQALRSRRITIFRAVAALFRHVVEALGDNERFDDLRLVVLGGDRVDWSDFDLFKRACATHARFGVHLGSTEVSLYLEWYVDESIRPGSPLLPVGRPVPDRATLLLGEDGEPVRHGEIGEFAVSSRYIALGYWPPSELTAPFSIDPTDPHARLYRTGDLGRRRPDGLYEHVGRKDQQIKLHGYRVEPAEIEAALKDSAGVRDAAIVVRRDEAGVPRAMAGYVEPRPDAGPISPQVLLRALAQRVPRHMVPATLHVLEPLPRLPSLKIDRVRLDEIDASRRIATRSDQPMANGTGAPAQADAAMRKVLVEALRQATGKSSKRGLGLQWADPNFDMPVAELGIDSLHWIAWCMEIEARTGIEIDPDDIMGVASIGELARLVGERGNGTAAARAPRSLRQAPRDRPLPLSFAQERVWKHHRSNPTAFVSGPSDHIVGPLDSEMFRDCLDTIVKRHEILRTTFDMVGGEPVQVVHPAAPAPLRVIHLSPSANAEEEIARIIREEMREVADLRRGPLMRFALVGIRPNEHRLIRVCHHILWDAWSTEVMLGELAALYESRRDGAAAPLPEFEPVQYGGYAAWQRQTYRPGSPAYLRTVAWWEERFRKFPGQQALPFARRTPFPDADPASGRLRVPVGPALQQQLDRLRRERSTTAYTIWLSALLALLAEQRPEVAVGTYMTTRRRPDLQNVIGDFTSLALLGFRCDLRISFCDWLAQVRRGVTETEQHAEIAFEHLREAVGRLPAVEVIFGTPLDHAQADREFADLKLSRCPVVTSGRSGMSWGFTMNVFGTSNQICRVDFDARAYNPVAVRRFVDRLFMLLDAVASRPEQSLDAALRSSGTS